MEAKRKINICQEQGPQLCPLCHHQTYARHGFAVEFYHATTPKLRVVGSCVWSWYCCETIFAQARAHPCVKQNERMAYAMAKLAAKIKEDDGVYDKYGATMFGDPARN